MAFLRRPNIVYSLPSDLIFQKVCVLGLVFPFQECVCVLMCACSTEIRAQLIILLLTNVGWQEICDQIDRGVVFRSLKNLQILHKPGSMALRMNILNEVRASWLKVMCVTARLRNSFGSTGRPCALCTYTAWLCHKMRFSTGGRA